MVVLDAIRKKAWEFAFLAVFLGAGTFGLSKLAFWVFGWMGFAGGQAVADWVGGLLCIATSVAIVIFIIAYLIAPRPAELKEGRQDAHAGEIAIQGAIAIGAGIARPTEWTWIRHLPACTARVLIKKSGDAQALLLEWGENDRSHSKRGKTLTESGVLLLMTEEPPVAKEQRKDWEKAESEASDEARYGDGTCLIQVDGRTVGLLAVPASGAGEYNWRIAYGTQGLRMRLGL